MSELQRRAPLRQAGAVTIEFALLVMFGLVPMLLLTYAGVMIMAAQQTLSLSASEGARATLLYGTDAERRGAACQAASRSMRWLLNFSGSPVDCASAGAPPVVVSQRMACTGNPGAQCIEVTTSFDHNAHPFIPGIGRLYGWVLDRPLSSSAVAQIESEAP
jgi:Flp pilus assembly protein TadG